MIDIDLGALEQMMKDFLGDLDALAFCEVKKQPEYAELRARIKILPKTTLWY